MTQKRVDFPAIHLHIELVDSLELIVIDFGQVLNLQHISLIDCLGLPDLFYRFKIGLAAFISFSHLLAAVLDLSVRIRLAELDTEAEEPVLSEPARDPRQDPREVDSDSRREDAKGCHQDYAVLNSVVQNRSRHIGP